MAATGPMLTEFAPQLYVHDGCKRFFGFRIQRCMTVVRLAGDRLFVHSPNRLDDSLRANLDRLGTVSFVVAPNKLHNFAIDEFATAYPSAVFFAAPGLPERRPDLRCDAILGDRAPAEWADEIDQVVVGGNVFFSEVVFLHRSSRTLIVTDLVENIGREHVSPWGRCVCRLMGIYGKPAPAPEHSMYTLDPEAAEESLERIAAWEFDRIVLAHGTRIERDGKRVFAQVTEDLLRRARQRGRIRRGLYRRMSKWQ